MSVSVIRGSGSFAKFAVIRRASSLLTRQLLCDPGQGLSLRTKLGSLPGPARAPSILRMAQLSRGAHKCADEIDVLGAIAARGERECRT